MNYEIRTINDLLKVPADRRDACWKDIKLTHPLFAGDTLSAESEVLDKRESKSRPNAGIVSVRTRGFNQHGVVVCEFDRTMLIAKRGYDVEKKANY